MPYRDFLNGYPKADPILINFLQKRFKLLPGLLEVQFLRALTVLIFSGTCAKFNFFAIPLIIILAGCKFGLKIFLVLFLHAKHYVRYIIPFPQLKHCAAIICTL